jgi:transcription elongation factor GreA
MIKSEDLEMKASKQNVSLDEAASLFLSSLTPEEKEVNQQEVYKFIRWFGRERPLAELSPPEVANYAQQLSLSDPHYITKFKLIRAFLNYVNKKGLSQGNLATHFKTRHTKTKMVTSAGQGLPKTVSLTQRGYTELETELAYLKNKRSKVIDEIRRAAADKDFRENAPLEAAREEHGQLVGRIRELEKTLGAAIILDVDQKMTRKVGIGDSVVLHDVSSGEDLRYMIVSPREVDPSRGKISSASPIGKVVIGQTQDQIIEVSVPAGKLHYQIKKIER